MKIGNFLRGKKWQTFIGYALTIFLLAVVAYGVFGYASGSVPYYVVSDRPSSMSPTIDYGGVVVIYKVPFSDLRPGDIIVFHDPLGSQLTIVHRIIQTIPNCPTFGSTCLITKGDNNATNPTADPWNVTQQFYVGKVILIVPDIGYLLPSLWASEGPLGYAPIILVVVVVLLLSFFRDAHKKTTATGDGESIPAERDETKTSVVTSSQKTNC